jgi:type VI secretion system secreted protein VgrG
MSDLYTFTVDGFPPDHFKVHVFTGRETISEPYAFDVVVTSDLTDDEEVERLALGQRAVLSWNIGMAPRAFYGIVAAVKLEEIHEAAPRSARYHMRLVPRLWLLKRKRRTRIFQQMRVRDVVDAVLGEAGIAARWALLREYPVREYCTQYEESDYRFITRLLAEAGIYFFFPEGPLDEDGAAAADALIPGDSVIFGDDTSGYAPIGVDERDAPGPGGAAPSLYFLEMQQTTASHADKVTRFSPRTTVRASTATFRDYDPERPMARLVSSAQSTEIFPSPDAPAVDPAVAAFTSAGTGAPSGLEVYEHHGPFLFPKWGFAKDEAALILRQKRRRASVASGESGCPDLAPGHRFTLENHPGAHLNQEYVVTTVEHRGEARPQGEGEWRTYRNTFTCAPAEITYIPPRPKRRSVQVALTATVVGPPGEEIHVDAMGQIKVQFHWDRDGAYDDRSSCWIRTMHAWGGAGWGAQFIPRVGMEVVVVFEGGDTDKPMVLGSLYNGTHPPPFVLPGDKTRSGWRTQSSPGGSGNNELSFEDAAANEQIYVHAQRDLDEVVERNHTLQVRGDESVRVLGSRVDIVEGDVIARVGGNEEAQVTGDQTSQVDGNRIDVVTGNSDERVSGMLVMRVEGKERREVQESADLGYADDLTVRVKGCMTTLVGKADKKRSWVTHAEGTAKLSSLESTEVSSEGELLLRVGKSWIRITDEKIELVSPAVTVKGAGAGISVDDAGLALSSKDEAQLIVEKKLVIMTKDGASLAMGKEVKIDGKKILMNSPEQAEDPPTKEPGPPTKIELKDQDGNALAYQRFLVIVDDGSEISGMTDQDGKAEINLKNGGKVVFPDLTKVEAG